MKVFYKFYMVNFKYLLFVTITLIEIQLSWGQNAMQPEVMDSNKMLFDNKLTRFFSVKEFEAHFKKADSTVLLINIQPCSYIFEYEDGSKDVDDEYWYKDGSRFERSKDKLAVDEFRFTNGHSIQYNNFNLNSTTTIAELNKHFPNAVKAIDELDVQGEGKLQVITLREDHANISDGQIRLFLKEGKLYFIHWWFPC